MWELLKSSHRRKFGEIGLHLTADFLFGWPPKSVGLLIVWPIKVMINLSNPSM